MVKGCQWSEGWRRWRRHFSPENKQIDDDDGGSCGDGGSYGDGGFCGDGDDGGDDFYNTYFLGGLSARRPCGSRWSG